MSRPRKLVVLLITSLLLCTGCRTWELSPRTVAEVVADDDEEVVRVRLRNGTFTEVRDPRLEESFLVGRGDVRIPTDQIVLTEVRRFDARRTGWVLIGVGVTVAVVAALLPEDRPDPPVSTTEPVLLSCPLVYSWDGHEWRLDSGTFGGAISRGLARTDVDNLEHVAVVDGEVRLRVANELAETDHLDELRIVLVDHPTGTSVAPGIRGGIHVLGPLTPPSRAADFRGRDILERVAATDGWSWESELMIREVRRDRAPRDGIEVVFPRPAGARSARLVLDGHNTPWSAFLLSRMIEAHGRETSAWYAALDTDPEAARAFGEHVAREAFLRASVWTGSQWEDQGVFWEAGPEIAKRQVLDLDLRAVRGDTVRLRLDAPPSFWLIDGVAMEFPGSGAKPVPIAVVEREATRALTSTGVNVRHLLAEADGRYLVLETGDHTDLSFRVPAPPLDHERTILLETHGWYRVHSSHRGELDREVLRSIESEPGGIARIATEELNRAVARLQGTGR